MTREIGDILIQQTVDSDYEIERKVRIIEKIEKLVMASLNIAASNLAIVAEKQISKEEQKEEAKQRLEAGETLREVSQDLPERIVREASKEIVRDECTQECTQDVHEPHANNVREVRKTKVEESKAEPKAEPKVEPTSEEPKEESPIIEPKKPVVVEGLIQVEDSPENELHAVNLIEHAKEVLGEDEYDSIRKVYNDGHPYKDLCKYWDYMSNNAGWPAREE